MVTENTTPNRGYQEPAVGNTLEVDVGRLIAALRAIDTDVASALAAIVAKAGLASPAFTGTPTAPTAAPGTDSGQLATTAFVKAALTALVDSAPGALDTLNELAAAIGDDPNFAATMAALIGTKADAAATTAALAGKADAAATTAALAARVRTDAPQTFTASQRSQGRANIDAPLRGHIYGLTLANNATDATNDIDITAGEAASDAATPRLMVLGSTLTKRLDAAWAVGPGNGGLDAGSKANSTGYHVWLIMRSDTGVVDALFSTSATSPTMPANYDHKYRIGWVITDGAGAIRSFAQAGNIFTFLNPTLDATAVGNTAGALYSLPIPVGVPIVVNLRAIVTATSAYFLFSSPLQPSVIPNTTSGGSNASSSGGGVGVEINVLTIDGQIRVRSGATGTFWVYVNGWVDKRGRE